MVLQNFHKRGGIGFLLSVLWTRFALLLTLDWRVCCGALLRAKSATGLALKAIRRPMLSAKWRFLPVLLLACGGVSAAQICYNPLTQSMPGGVGVTTSGTCNVDATSSNGDVPGFLLNPGAVTGATQSCALTFAVPVTNLTVSIGAHSCTSLACEKAVFEVNGSHHPVLPAELTTPFAYYDEAIQGPAFSVSIDADRNIVGSAEASGAFIGNGTGRVAFSEPAVSSINITEVTTNAMGTIGPSGSWFDVCYDGVAAEAPKLTIKKTSVGGAATFSFKGGANANGFPTDGLYKITTVNPGETISGDTVVLAAANVLTEIQEVLPNGWSLTSASCVEAANAGQPNAPSFGIVLQDTLQIPAHQLQTGSDVQCTFVNTFTGFSVSGKVILDNGSGSGTAHDAIQNGTEAAQSGVALSLTDCAGTTYNTTTSGSDGSFSLSLAGAPIGQDVCVVQTLPSAYSQVSVGFGTTAGSFDSGAVALKFTPAPSTDYTGVVLGNAHVGTLSSDGAQQTTAGQTVTYSHIYTAGSAGDVVFTTSSTNASGTAWSRTLFLDANCSGTLDAGEATLAGVLAVTAGQQVCVINRVSTPAGLAGGEQDTTLLTATQTWTTPTLSPAVQTHVLNNTEVTTIASSGLSLLKEVRKLSSCPATSAESEANSTAYSTSGNARPGDALEYRLRYSNTTAAPINSVTIYDAIPAFTSFVAAYCLTTPTQGIDACAVTLQPAIGASSGSIIWTLSDAPGALEGLQPSDSGTVGFCINVAQ